MRVRKIDYDSLPTKKQFQDVTSLGDLPGKPPSFFQKKPSRPEYLKKIDAALEALEPPKQKGGFFAGIFSKKEKEMTAEDIEEQRETKLATLLGLLMQADPANQRNVAIAKNKLIGEDGNPVLTKIVHDTVITDLMKKTQEALNNILIQRSTQTPMKSATDAVATRERSSSESRRNSTY